jgi:dipeptidyl aminopeptidase/acylaminoacyl peptidase
VPFRGIIAIAGVSNFFSHFDSPQNKQRSWIPKQFGLSLEESFAKMSAVRWPEKIQKPLLIVHGTNDSDVPISQSSTLAKLLDKSGAPYKFVEMKGGEHHLLFSKTEEFEKIAFPWLNSLKK